VKADGCGGNDQTRWAFPLDQARLEAVPCLLDRLVPDSSFGKQTSDQVAGEVGFEAGGFVEDEEPVPQRLGAISEGAFAHRGQRVVRVWREELAHRLDGDALAARARPLRRDRRGACEEPACEREIQKLPGSFLADDAGTLEIGSEPVEDPWFTSERARRLPCSSTTDVGCDPLMLDVRLPREQKTEIVPPTAEHVLAVHDVLPPRYRLPMLVLDGTGMRLGELEYLTWGDVDESRGRWRVSAAVSKTSRARWVPVPPPLFAAVLELCPRDDRAPERRVFEGFGGDSSARRSRGRAPLPVCPRFRRMTSAIGESRCSTSPACPGPGSASTSDSGTSPSPRTPTPMSWSRKTSSTTRICSGMPGRDRVVSPLVATRREERPFLQACSIPTRPIASDGALAGGSTHEPAH
jgi:hypothetical protein